MFEAIRLILMVVMIGGILAGFLGTRRHGTASQTRAFGFWLAGTVLTCLPEFLHRFGLPREHGAYWGIWTIGLVLLLVTFRIACKIANAATRPESNP